MTPANLAAATERNRRLFADVVDALSVEQHDAATLCTGWTVRTLTAHMLQPMEVGVPRFLLASIRHRGRVGPTVDAIARRLAKAEVPELTSRLRAAAAQQVSPPRVGPDGPFADTCIHLRDLARPLGIDADVPLGDWRHLLDYLVSPRVAPALVPSGRLDGLALSATDQAWSALDGARVEGPSEALAMAAAGRRAALADLEGPGVQVLGGRLTRPGR